MNEFLVIAGLSGAGRSTAAAALEDLGWEVIDNLPPRLIPELTGSAERLALVVGRSLDRAEVDGIEVALAHLRSSGATVQVLFLDAADDVLVRRYEGTRRRHPVQGEEGVVGSIARERELLASIKAQADVVVDTTDLNVHQLRDRLVRTFGRDDPAGNMRTAVVSFGYTHGIPLDVDLVFDCRFLPNPYWDDALRPFTGLDEKVKAFVLGQPETGAFLDKLDDLFGLLLPAYVKEGKSYLTIAVGCTGGHHRSVALAQEIADRLGAQGFAPTVHHRDIER